MSGFIFRRPRGPIPKPSEVLNFLDPTASIDFDLKPEQALAFFRDKGLQATFDWRDMLGKEHDAAFTVAKMMDTDLLATVRQSLDKAMENGETFKNWADNLVPTLQKAGWWGKQDVIDPLTGQLVTAQLGSAHRLETIFRANLQNAYSVGHWESIQDGKAEAPFLMYDAVDDGRTRPEHRALDAKVVEVDDPFWAEYFPPNGWNCRCGVIQLSQEDLDSMGLVKSPSPKIKRKSWENPRTGITHHVPIDLDPGWNHNPGIARYAKLKALEAEKAQQLPADMAKAAAKANAAEAQKIAGQAVKAASLKQALKDALETDEKLAIIAKETQAAATLKQIKDEQTPKLALALKQVEGSKAAETMSASELLDAVIAKAEQNKKNSDLAHYKSDSIKGKTPGPAAQAAFDSLPDEAKAAMLDAIAEKSGANEAKAKLADILENPKGQTLKNKALTDYLNQGGTITAANAKQVLADIEIAAAEAQAKKTQASILSGYKKKILDGKIPTPQQIAVFNSLDDAGKEKVLADIDKKAQAKADELFPDEIPAQAAPEASLAVRREKALSFSAMTKIGAQKGSNEGGFYQDTETGEKYYIKTPSSEDIGRSEVLAAKLYELAGVDVPELYEIDVNGRFGIASKIIDDLEQDRDKAKTASGTAEGFAVDAWLANWDVVGLGYDNLLVKAGKAYRVDVGGALEYRAMGGAKGSLFGNVVTELESLRDRNVNSQAAYVFADLTTRQIEESVRRVLKVSDADIMATVKRYGPGDDLDKDALARKLVARKQNLAERFPHLVDQEKPEALPDQGDRVTLAEHLRITGSRQNGYMIPTDKDQIEDHAVLLWTEKVGGGRTHAQMKLTAAGRKVIERYLDQQELDNNPKTPKVDNLADKIVTAIKGIKANPGQTRDKDLERINDAVNALAAAIKELDELRADGKISGPTRLEAADYYRQWIERLQAIANTRDNNLVDTSWGMFGYTLKFVKPKSETTEIKLAKKSGFNYEIKDIKNGFVESAAETTRQTSELGRHNVFETEIDGVTVRYWGEGENQFAIEGRLELVAKGTDREQSQALFGVMEKLGINAARETDLDRQELYLIRTLYHMNDTWPDISDRPQFERIDLLRQYYYLLRDKFPEDEPGYNLDGERGAFGDNYLRHYRPDVGTPEFEQFRKEHRLYHDITNGGMVDAIKAILNSGGMMAATTDKLRRGIPVGGMSPSADMRSGGAQYVFTRLKRASSSSSGLFWDSRHVARLDAISYDHDAYGRTRDDHVRKNRKSTIDEWRAAAGNSSNETIFKDGLSIFDGLDKIVTNGERQRKEVIQVFKDAGYSKWPDGRKLEDVIK